MQKRRRWDSCAFRCGVPASCSRHCSQRSRCSLSARRTCRREDRFCREGRGALFGVLEVPATRGRTSTKRRGVACRHRENRLAIPATSRIQAGRRSSQRFWPVCSSEPKLSEARISCISSGKSRKTAEARRPRHKALSAAGVSALLTSRRSDCSLVASRERRAARGRRASLTAARRQGRQPARQSRIGRAVV